MLRIAIVAACLLSLLAACGDGDENGGDAGAPAAANLTVIVRPDGPGGPVKERPVVCERLGEGKPVCRSLTLEKLAPVPRSTPCTSIYGGPALARVRGTIEGERVDERFSREDGCQIARWDRNRALLEPSSSG
ncbi:MAG: hypothetical protein ACRDN8_27935 [Thermoleophilaceae bacterium]